MSSVLLKNPRRLNSTEMEFRSRIVQLEKFKKTNSHEVQKIIIKESRLKTDLFLAIKEKQHDYPNDNMNIDKMYEDLRAIYDNEVKK